ncbi:MAG: acyl-CoA thioesterase/BAAT N-terminal domain-containing protein [Gemmatimonadaceae bacterium]|jgi:dienelactone hydrolase|nr:acyl-CoA thioesterase/BAAT N-terminal domain-containing protein [Gemmatimonadaceae bacterium]
MHPTLLSLALAAGALAAALVRPHDARIVEPRDCRWFDGTRTVAGARSMRAECAGARPPGDDTATRRARLVLPDSARLVAGRALTVRIAGAAPGETLVVRARRTLRVERRTGRRWATVTLPAASEATVVADGAGQIDLSRAVPVSGTWRDADGEALLWSMREARDTLAGELDRPSRTVAVALRHGDTVLDTATLHLVEPAPIVTRSVTLDGIAGTLVAPAGARRRPVVLVLHGSEGADSASVREMAMPFVALGYAAMGVAYYTGGRTGSFAGVPTAFDGIDVQGLARLRDWLGAQPEADTARTAIWGVSKGGELAMLAASRFRWPRAIVGCVPSDVMWAGFGRQTAQWDTLVSWRDGAVRLPAIPYVRYERVFADTLVTARQVHDESRAAVPAPLRVAARIPVERTRSPLLLIGGDADALWASGPMVDSIAATVRRLAPRVPVEAHRYAGAGHGLCGPGTQPVPWFGVERDPASLASARARADAWRRTVAFLARWLGAPREHASRDRASD